MQSSFVLMNGLGCTQELKIFVFINIIINIIKSNDNDFMILYTVKRVPGVTRVT